MKAVIRAILGVFAGLFAAFVVVVAVEWFSSVVDPFPENFGGTEEEICQHVERIPTWLLAVAVPLWAAAGFIGTWTAQKIGNIYSASTVGLLLFAALVLNVSMLPYPIWFKAAMLIALPIAMAAGCRLANKSRRPAAATGSASETFTRE